MATNEKKRGRTWEKEETLVLLEKWGEDNVQERLKECKRKKPIWEEISGHVKASGYEDRESESCKTRIHTLVSAYRTYKDQTSKTGTATAKKPPFFSELDDILSDKPATRPLMVLNSANVEQKENELNEVDHDNENDDSDVDDEVDSDEQDAQYPELKKGAKRLTGKMVILLFTFFVTFEPFKGASCNMISIIM